MQLEHIELRCLKYLKQCKNPLVPFEQLYRHCKEDESCARVTEQQLMEFLRNHTEVRVLEGPAEGEPVCADTFAAAGFIMGTRIIHRDRVPTQLELAAMIKEHIAGVITTLEDALKHPATRKQPERLAQLGEALNRARALQEKISKSL